MFYVLVFVGRRRVKKMRHQTTQKTGSDYTSGARQHILPEWPQVALSLRCLYLFLLLITLSSCRHLCALRHSVALSANIHKHNISFWTLAALAETTYPALTPHELWSLTWPAECRGPSPHKMKSHSWYTFSDFNHHLLILSGGIQLQQCLER